MEGEDPNVTSTTIPLSSWCSSSRSGGADYHIQPTKARKGFSLTFNTIRGACTTYRRPKTTACSVDDGRSAQRRTTVP
jgi:hypothetical protein